MSHELTVPPLFEDAERTAIGTGALVVAQMDVEVRSSSEGKSIAELEEAMKGASYYLPKAMSRAGHLPWRPGSRKATSWSWSPPAVVFPRCWRARMPQRLPRGTGRQPSRKPRDLVEPVLDTHPTFQSRSRARLLQGTGRTAHYLHIM